MEKLNKFLDYNQDWCNDKTIRLVNCRKNNDKYESGWISLMLEKDTLTGIIFEPKHELEHKLRKALKIADDKKGLLFSKPLSRKKLTGFVQWAMQDGTTTHVHGYMWGGDDQFYQVAIKGDLHYKDVFGEPTTNATNV